MVAGFFPILVLAPIVAGFLLLFITNGKLKISLILWIFALGLAVSILSFLRPAQMLTINLIGDYDLAIGLNKISKLILVFVNLFVLLTAVYSRDLIAKSRVYCSYLAWLAAFSSLAVLAVDFILFIFAWGADLALMYAFLNLGSSRVAKKALAIVGVADFSLMLGICLYVTATATTLMPLAAKQALDTPLIWASFILMLVGALAKSGCGPFHTWIPEASQSAPIPVMAVLPASLDKLLGIYLLSRICLDFFALNNLALGLLLIVASLTIIFAVMLALIQHDLRKLLSFHAISQVGYMVFGFATGTSAGIAGGLFHMLNNAIYKSGLFFTAGAVGSKKKTFELDKLGRLAVYMPLTFVCGLVFSLSISGIPPLNGFASKWLLYQGAIIGLFNTQSQVLRIIYLFGLTAAMFGSALTLASFVKFIHAVFLGQEDALDKKPIKEVSMDMRVPLLVLAALCVFLGIFSATFLKYCIEPGLGEKIYQIGSWDSQLAFLLLVLSLCAGLAFWNANRSKKFRTDGFFIGGEEPQEPVSYPATQFYKTIQEMPSLSGLYRLMKLESLDIYNIMGGIINVCSHFVFVFVDRIIYYLTNLAGYAVLGVSWLFRRLHTGKLDFYLAWTLAGLIGVFFILMGR